MEGNRQKAYIVAQLAIIILNRIFFGIPYVTCANILT